jgi:hypothetical protein
VFLTTFQKGDKTTPKGEEEEEDKEERLRRRPTRPTRRFVGGVFLLRR